MRVRAVRGAGGCPWEVEEEDVVEHERELPARKERVGCRVIGSIWPSATPSMRWSGMRCLAPKRVGSQQMVDPPVPADLTLRLPKDLGQVSTVVEERELNV